MLVAVNLAAVTAFLLSYSRHGVGFGPYRIDLGVYRMGGWTWWHGGNLYSQVLVAEGLRLPFTYPPVAAIVLAPLALLPMAVAGTVVTLASVALVAVVLGLVVRRLGERGVTAPWMGKTPWTGNTLWTGKTLWAVLWLLPVVLALEPMRSALEYGQIDVILMALVAVDCLAVNPRWPRGVLVGVAAAVKLTPAAFVLYFLVRRDYRAAATAGVSWAVATAAGFVLAGPDSVRYWTSDVFQTGRIGGSATAANQSLQGVLARAGLDPHTIAGMTTWLVLAAVVVVLAGRGMRYALAAGQDGWALSLNAFAALLISPISWSHHWVWCAPALLVLADMGRRNRSRLALAVAAGGLVLFLAAPQWLLGKFGGSAGAWAPWEQAVGNSYVWFAVLVLVLSAGGWLGPALRLPRRVPRRASGGRGPRTPRASADSGARVPAGRSAG